MSLFTFASTLRAGSGVCWRQHAAWKFAVSLRHRTSVANKVIPQEWKIPGVQLPPAEEWPKVFRFTDKQKRKTLSNPETAKRLAEIFVPEGSKDKVIVEAYAGAGMLTRALMDLPRERIRKIILLEDEEGFFDWLEPLQKVDDRVTLMKYSGFHWKTYKDMESNGTLDGVEVCDWNAGLHPQLQFISQIPNNVHGEQLIAQLCRAVPDRNWLFRFGRVPLDIIPSAALWGRLSAGPHSPTRICKLSVVTQAVADLFTTMPASELIPPENHFYSPSGNSTRRRSHAGSAAQQPLRIVPLEDQIIGPGDLEIWDYVLRHIFVLKATPLTKAILGLGPGAASLLKKISDPSLPREYQVDATKFPTQLTLKEWKTITKAFEEWPFRPEILTIHGGLVSSGDRV